MPELKLALFSEFAPEKAKELATELNIPYFNQPEALSTYDLYLDLDKNGLKLKSKSPLKGELMVDFLAPKLLRRLNHLSYKHELILQALGRHSQPLTIIDATAGLGHDAAIFAARGHKVLMLERSKIVFALLNDALLRLNAADHPLATHLELLKADAHHYLAKVVPGSVDVIYLDPLFPERPKTALNQQNLRLLRMLTGDDLDAATLLPLALQAANRVIVKRAKDSPYLNQQKPALECSVPRGSSRYDVYFSGK